MQTRNLSWRPITSVYIVLEYAIYSSNTSPDTVLVQVVFIFV